MFLYHLFLDFDDTLDLNDFEPVIKTNYKRNLDWRIGNIEMNIVTAQFEELETTPTSGVLRLFRSTVMNEFELDSTVLCVLAVPLYMTPQDFLKLMGASRNDLLHVRIFKDQVPNRFMILLKFKNIESTSAFYSDFNGKPFSSFEAELCQVVYIQSIIMNIATNTNPDEPESPSSSISGNPILIELPTCPVCLDRMDSTVTGVFTTLCQHTFHCHCIMRWGDTTCPVCRYSHETTQENNCYDCQSSENLWICLICANVGCGRYQNLTRYVSGHSQEHYKNTGHVYSLELETQRVWDYLGDSYVHRLIDGGDGKLVELPPRTNFQEPNASKSGTASEIHEMGYRFRTGLDMNDPNGLVSPFDIAIAEKIESVGEEYQNLVESRLSTQKRDHNRQISQMEVFSVEIITQLESRISKLEVENSRVAQERDEFRNMLKESQNHSLKMQRRMEKLMTRVEKSEKTLSEETLMNQSLRSNNALLIDQLASKDNTIEALKQETEELKEQARDLMFFLETQQKVEQMDGVKDATVVGVSERPEKPKTPNRKGKNKKHG